MSKITIQKDSTLLVPDVPTVPYITGDGVGAEVTPSMQIIVDAAVRKAYGGKRHIEWLEVLAGERAFNETGSWLPEANDAGISGISGRNQRSVDYTSWRWNPFVECCFAADT